jgi:hypothetical protein
MDSIPEAVENEAPVLKYPDASDKREAVRVLLPSATVRSYVDELKFNCVLNPPFPIGKY